MKLDFSKIEFRVNWASASTIVTLLVGIITLFMTNQNLKGKVDGLQKSNEALNTTIQTLSATVNTLKGSQDITNNAISLFMNNPPQEIKYRVERLEDRVFGSNAPAMTPPTQFENKKPK